jgi:hypothetical protein
VTLALEETASKKNRRNLKPSFIFSTTRNWNPGDDFILYGVRNLIESVISEFNPVIYDRNPDHYFLQGSKLTTACGKSINMERLLGELATFRNSLTSNESFPDIDLAIFAGSPEWSGNMLKPFNEFILKSKLPSIYLGIGGHNKVDKIKYENLSILDQKVLQESLLVVTRDQLASDVLFPHIKTHMLSCPALFSSKTATKRTQKKRIALNSQENGKYTPISEEITQYSIELFKELIDLFDCEIVCHYKNDYNFLAPIFGSQVKIRYSYDPKDYFDIYKDFDLTVTTRVHGAGICASMGIPGVCLSHTKRIETVKGFLSEIINPKEMSVKEAVKLIQDLDVPKRSEEIINLKSQMLQKYQGFLKPVFQDLGFC